MFNVKTLDYETKIYILICGLWSLNLLEPSFFINTNDLNSILANRKKNLGYFKLKTLKLLYKSFQGTNIKHDARELLYLLEDIGGTTNKPFNLRNSLTTKILKNYLQRFKFFYLYYFNHLPSKHLTIKDLNTLAISVLFFLIT